MILFNHRGAGAPGRHARGYTLVYMLALIPLLAVIITLLVRGTGSILRAQRAAVLRTNEYATLNDWLDALRNDTRRAAAITLTSASNQAPGPMIELTTSRGRITYRFADGDVVRTIGPAGGRSVTGRWVLPSMVVDLSLSPFKAGDLLQVVVEWKRVARRRLEEPVRRFETIFFVGRSYTP